jgi:outer membrane lipoprotein carrier protein
MQKGFFVIVFSLTFWNCFTQNFKRIENPAVIKNRLEEAHRETKSFSADFIETAHSSMFVKPQKGKGKVYFKKPEKIRWEQTDLKNQIILLNGKSIRISKGGKEVTNEQSKIVFKRIQNMMIQMLSGSFLNEKDFKILYYERNEQIKLHLLPKNQRLSRYIKRIELLFDKKTLTLLEMTMIEDETEKMVYTFFNVSINKTLNDSLFNQF